MVRHAAALSAPAAAVTLQWQLRHNCRMHSRMQDTSRCCCSRLQPLGRQAAVWPTAFLSVVFCKQALDSMDTSWLQWLHGSVFLGSEALQDWSVCRTILAVLGVYMWHK